MPQPFKTVVSLSLGLIAALLCSVAGAERLEAVAEPAGYQTRQYQSEVPLTVAGARVIETAQQLQRFLQENSRAVLLDVFPAARKPDNLPANELWIEPKRRTLPAAVWLANTGFGDLPDEIETLLKSQLRLLTEGDKQQPVVIFCEPACWHSWNAAKRAASYGYTNIHWYRQGVTGWRQAGFPVQAKRPTRP